MEKLKKVIEEYSEWKEITIYVDRIESHLETDFSHSLENAKALLETIGKEICEKNGVALAANSPINGVMKKCFQAMGFTNSTMVQQVSQSLANIGQQVGNLRNEIGLTSHGKSLEEIKQRNNRVDTLTREFLVDTIESISVFIIRNFENKKETRQTEQTAEILPDELDYYEAEEFNASWDDTYGEFSMGDYSYLASEILFNVDKQAYETEYTTFNESSE